jgi:hypothetical protein
MKFKIGFIAFLISSTQFLPQVYKVWITNDTGSLSTLSILIYLIGQNFWFMHTFSTKDKILRTQIIINIICFSYLFYKKYMNGEITNPINSNKELHEHI